MAGVCVNNKLKTGQENKIHKTLGKVDVLLNVTRILIINTDFNLALQLSTLA
jgi:hypothetical protein